MGIYAYISIFEAFSKLLVVYIIVKTSYDKLILYAFLLMLVQFIVAMFYRLYCQHTFVETKLRRVFDKTLFKSLLGFSGWNLTANIVEMLQKQGVIVLINMFFQPAIVAAQAVGNQITNALMEFVNNVRTAVNPQIIKYYASGDYEESKKLTLSSTVYIFDLLLLICIPIMLLMDPILNLWLVKVPPYAAVFAQYILAQQIIGSFSASFYTPMLASGKIKKNSLASVCVGFTQFIILYFVLKLGGDVMWIPYMATLAAFIWSCAVKPYILYKDLNYSISDIGKCYWNCLKVLLPSLAILLPLKYVIHNTLFNNILILFVSVTVIITFSLVFMEKSTRNKLFTLIYMKVRRG